MEPPASRHCTLPCAHCGRAAAEITLLPATAHGESRWHDRERLERTDFMGTFTKFGHPDHLAQLFEAVCSGNFEAAQALDADFVAFYCHACGQPYCDNCWRLEPPVFDEGFYDYTLGRCPEGHEQVVDD